MERGAWSMAWWKEVQGGSLLSFLGRFLIFVKIGIFETAIRFQIRTR